MEEEGFKFVKEFHEDTSIPEDKKIKIEKIDKCLKTAPINLNSLRNLCITEHGLCFKEYRKRVWPYLLNIHNQSNVRDVNLNNNSQTPICFVDDNEESWKK